MCFWFGLSVVCFHCGIISSYIEPTEKKLDICVQNLPVTIIGVGAGLAYGVDGPTHHGTEDINALASLPNIEILNPSDDCSARASVRFAFSLKTPCFIRMDKEQLPKLYLNNVDLDKALKSMVIDDAVILQRNDSLVGLD